MCNIVELVINILKWINLIYSILLLWVIYLLKARLAEMVFENNIKLWKGLSDQNDSCHIIVKRDSFKTQMWLTISSNVCIWNFKNKEIPLSQQEQHVAKERNQSTSWNVLKLQFSFSSWIPWQRLRGSALPVSLPHTWTSTQVFLHPWINGRWPLIPWVDLSTFFVLLEVEPPSLLEESGGGTGLVADSPTMWQPVQSSQNILHDKMLILRDANHDYDNITFK